MSGGTEDSTTDSRMQSNNAAVGCICTSHQSLASRLNDEGGC
jgi:hypothetical protein